MSPQLGRTGLHVTRLGLGLAALGRPGYINLGHHDDFAGHTEIDEMERHAHDVLDAAYAAGVRYFDAARSYGRAEMFLGSWLRARGLNRDEVTVGSKWGYTYTADWRVDVEVHEVKELTIETLRRQIVETRAELGENLCLYQIHSATVDSGVFEDDAVLGMLAELRHGGLAIGFSATGPNQAATVERALEVGGFDSVQATWNLHEQSAGPALAAAHEAGLGVLIKEAVANGRLTTRGDTPLLTELADELGTTEDALALAAVLAQPWVDVVLSGASSKDQLASNLAAGELTLGAEHQERLATLREDPDAYWETRSALPWN
jgi:aryl-alcohol dehydrogenase-like predicted oxidoreductase